MVPAKDPAAGRLPARLRRESRLARIYDSEILPLWSRHFGKLLLRQVKLPAISRSRATVLDVLCGTGCLSLDLLRRCGDGVRLIAIDPSSAMLDAARQKAGAAAGRRIFFRSEAAEPALPFPPDLYDAVLSNLGLCEVSEPRRLLGEMVRVARPGGRVVATLPLQGTYAEFLDLFEGVLEEGAADGADGQEALLRLSAYRSSLPSAGEARSWLAEAGLCELDVQVAHFTLLFAGGREFFFAPVIEYGPLQAWKDVVGQGPHMQEVFRRLKDEIDRLCHLHRDAGDGLCGLPAPFAVTVRAGCLSGRKPLPGEERLPPAAEPGTGEVELNSSEIDILGLLDATGPSGQGRKGTP